MPPEALLVSTFGPGWWHSVSARSDSQAAAAAAVRWRRDVGSTAATVLIMKIGVIVSSVALLVAVAGCSSGKTTPEDCAPIDDETARVLCIREATWDSHDDAFRKEFCDYWKTNDQQASYQEFATAAEDSRAQYDPPLQTRYQTFEEYRDFNNEKCASL